MGSQFKVESTVRSRERQVTPITKGFLSLPPTGETSVRTDIEDGHWIVWVQHDDGPAGSYAEWIPHHFHHYVDAVDCLAMNETCYLTWVWHRKGV